MKTYHSEPAWNYETSLTYFFPRVPAKYPRICKANTNLIYIHFTPIHVWEYTWNSNANCVYYWNNSSVWIKAVIVIASSPSPLTHFIMHTSRSFHIYTVHSFITTTEAWYNAVLGVHKKNDILLSNSFARTNKSPCTPKIIRNYI